MVAGAENIVKSFAFVPVILYVKLIVISQIFLMSDPEKKFVPTTTGP